MKKKQDESMIQNKKKNEFYGKTIVVGVCGGIASYKVVEIVKKLKKRGAIVHIIMTESAVKLVDPKEFEKVSKNKVMTSLFHPSIDYREYLKKNKPITHMSLADSADLFIICPATANVIGKIANGICDDLLTTSVSATSADVLICPAMNVKMWNNPFVQKNVERLGKEGYHVVDPEYGDLACGYKGVGRLAKGEKIRKEAERLLRKRSDLKGKKIVISYGATSEPIDPVRVITNRSSGKMGAALGEEAYRRGAKVVLIRGESSKSPRYPIEESIIRTSSDLDSALRSKAKDADIIIHAAAVSDFTIEPKKSKISSKGPLHLELSPSNKILERIREWNKKTFLVGFKAEHKVSKEELEEKAYAILKSSDADLIVANDVGKKGRGFDSETNEVWIVDKKKASIHLPLQDKRMIAEGILDEVVRRI